MIKAVYHLGAVVKDMEKTLDFYINKLGAKLEWDYREGPQQGQQTDVIFCEEDTSVYVAGINLYGIVIEFFQFLNHEGISSDFANLKSLGWKHVALEVDDIDETYHYLEEMGIEFLSSVQILANGDKMVYFKDPDGLVLELNQPDQ